MGDFSLTQPPPIRPPPFIPPPLDSPTRGQAATNQRVYTTDKAHIINKIPNVDRLAAKPKVVKQIPEPVDPITAMLPKEQNELEELKQLSLTKEPLAPVTPAQNQSSQTQKTEEPKELPVVANFIPKEPPLHRSKL